MAEQRLTIPPYPPRKQKPTNHTTKETDTTHRKNMTTVPLKNDDDQEVLGTVSSINEIVNKHFKFF